MRFVDTRLDCWWGFMAVSPWQRSEEPLSDSLGLTSGSVVPASEKANRRLGSDRDCQESCVRGRLRHHA